MESQIPSDLDTAHTLPYEAYTTQKVLRVVVFKRKRLEALISQGPPI